MTPFVYFLIISYIPTVLGLWKLFEKAGEQGWKAVIPFYNIVVLLKIIKRPWWWLILFIVPTVSFIMWWIMTYMLYSAMGKKNWVEKLLGSIFWFVYLPYLTTQKDVVYTTPVDEKDAKRSWMVEWVDAALFAVVAATVIRTFFIEAFTIPTSSLEKSLMVGDYLFVSKASYGAKTPQTPLAFPFAHHTMFLTESTPSYVEWIKLPYFRLPGFGKVKNNDYVVFNYPDGDTVAVNYQNRSYYEICRENGYKSLYNNPYGLIKVGRDEYTQKPIYDSIGEIIARPPDKREHYVKRCVAIGGDKVEIKNSVFYINDMPAYVSQHMQHHYIVTMNPGITLNQQFLSKQFDITEEIRQVNENSYLITLPYDKVEQFKLLGGVLSLTPYIEEKNIFDSYIYPHNANYKWNKDNWGPFVMPKEGATVNLDTTNIVLYDRIITTYEGNKLEIKNGQIFINDVATTSYTFKMNYYFMIGDNRHNSADSRYWGLVPEDHIVGKPVFIWMSWKTGFLKDGRWDRFFTFVSSTGLSRSYFVHFIILVIAYNGFTYYRKRKSTGKVI